MDGIMTASNYVRAPKQRRLSCVLNNSPVAPGLNGPGSYAPWQLFQPYVIHTTGQFTVGYLGGAANPNHAIGFRTVDVTFNPVVYGAIPYFNGGGKLGIYCSWDPTSQCGVWPYVADVTDYPIQFEYYDYSTFTTTYRMGTMPR